jgi:YbbR domain-containing protein
MALRFITEDWTVKLFSLGVAVLLFLFVTVENATSVDVDFRIEYRTADDILVTNDAPTVLHATLQGPWARLRTFETTDLEPAVLDLSRAEPGAQRHSIDLSAVTAPGGMKVVAIRPSEVEVTLDRRVERQVPVRPDIPEAPAFGYEILDVRIVPARARVLGPGSKMQSIDFITTRTIDVMGREQDLNLEVDLRPPPPPLRLLDKRVSVFVEIGEEFTQRNFPNVPVRVEGAPKNSRISPVTVTLMLKGPRRTIDKINRSKMVAVVDVTAEVHDGEIDIEKLIQVSPALPERTQVVAPVPKISVQVPQGRRTKRR